SGSGVLGGLVGTNIGTITQSSAMGDVSGANGVSPIAFSLTDSSGLRTNIAPSSVTVPSIVGGLVGVNLGSITSSFASGNVSGNDASMVGGLVGMNSGSISTPFISSSEKFSLGGGLGGSAADGITGGAISASYAIGTVTGGSNSNAGGLVGVNLNSITASFAGGTVSVGNTSSGGGLVGTNVGSITDS